jgi:hypothetical protein
MRDFSFCCTSACVDVDRPFAEVDRGVFESELVCSSSKGITRYVLNVKYGHLSSYGLYNFCFWTVEILAILKCINLMGYI